MNSKKQKIFTLIIVFVVLTSAVYSGRFLPVIKGLTQVDLTPGDWDFVGGGSPFSRITATPTDQSSPFSRITATPVETRSTRFPSYAELTGREQSPLDLSERRQADQQTLQEEGRSIEQLQEQDRQQCQSQMGMGGGIPGGDMGLALNDGMQQVMQQTLSENIPEELQRQLQETLPQELTQEIQKTFSQQLSQSLQEDLRERLPSALNQATQGGSVTLTEDLFRDIFQNTFQESFLAQAPEALNKSMRDALPTALQNSIQSALPQSIENIMTNQFPADIQRMLPDILSRNLEGPVMDSLLDQNLPDRLRQDLQGGTSGFGEGGFFSGILDTFNIGEITRQNNQMDMLAVQMTQQISDDLVREITDNLMIGVNDQMDNIINQLTVSMDTELERLFSRGFAPLEQAIDSIIPQMTGSIDLLLEQSLGQFNNIFDEMVGGILDPVTGAFDQIIGGVLDPVTGAFDQIIGGVLDPVTGAFDQIIGGVLDPVTGALSGLTDSIISPLTGALDGITSGLLDPLTGALSGLTDSIMSPITGALSGLTDSIMSPITGALSGLTDSIMSPITNAIGGMTENIMGGLTESFGGVLGDTVGGVVGDTVGGVVGDTVSGVAGNVVGGVAGNVLGGMSPFGFGAVPVKEVNGPLLSTTKKIEKNTKEIDKTTKEIDKTTKSIEELLVEICTYQKSIQRIQTAAEQREVVEKAELRRQASTEMEQYRQDLIDFVGRGYKYGQNEERPLFVTNTQAHINEIITPETTKIYIDQLLNNSGDEFRQQTARIIERTESDIPRSTITKQDYDRFISGQVNNPNDWWSNLLSINNPNFANNPQTSFMLNQSALSRRQAVAEQNFRDEMIAGQGFLPVRECVEQTSDGQACARWEVITPATQVQETVASAFNYRTELYTSPEPGDVAPGNQPVIEEIRTFRPSNTGGGGSGSPGGGTAGFDISALLGMLSSLQQNQSFQKPEVSFTFSLPPVNQLERGVANIARINWQTKGVQSCTASNNWLVGSANTSAGQTFRTSQITRTTGQDLGVNNSLNINLPLGSSALLLRNRTTDDPPLRTVTDAVSTQISDNQLTVVTTITLPEDIMVGDSFRIAFWPFDLNHSVTVTVTEGRNTKAQLLEDLREAIVNAINPQNPNTAQRLEFSKYRFGYNATTGAEAIRIVPRLNYQITCVTEDNQRINEEITISR